MSTSTYGIDAFGVHVPSMGIDVREVAKVRGADPDKFTIGLGCSEMALCPAGTGVVEMATKAAERALAAWGGSRDDIGMICVGTESAVDMSRPLSAFVAEAIGLRGMIRSYEVKHACYGGTLALRQALEWRASGAGGDKVALVIAVDQALYTPGGPAEPTQGAGAVAMIVGEGRVARVSLRSHAYSAPAFDFWRPVGESWPRVAGKLSLDCYNEATVATFDSLLGTGATLEDYAAVCFHVPFPKMVKKAVRALGTSLGWDRDGSDAFYDAKVEPTMGWNKRSGNAYTASLWISVAHALVGMEAGTQLLAFSYGSGFGAELLELEAGPDAAAGAWATEVEADFAERQMLDGASYLELRSVETARIAAK
jgi:hydroxymethylglutaryl-CoA synthase